MKTDKKQGMSFSLGLNRRPFEENASYVGIFFCVCTDYENKGCLDACGRLLKNAAKVGFKEIKKAHIEEYGSLYNSMKLEIETDRKLEKLPSDELLKRCKEPEIQGYLTQLMFAYARYLLISSSYHCALPANLQGIWNGSFTPPWESGYTININLQMNY